MSKFSHLHTHSHYSLLSALPKLPELVAKAKDCGMPDLGLTDNGNMYGAIEFYKECKKQGIKPILGVDFYMAARTRNDREPRIDNKRTRIVLLAKNAEGYKNLIKLVTLSNFEGFYYKPRIDRELLEKYKNDLICISLSFSGDIATALKNGNPEMAEELCSYYKNLFGEDFFIEISHHPEIEGHEENMKNLTALAKKCDVQIVAAHDVYYLEPGDRKARNTLVSIQNEFSERTASDDESDFSFIDQKTAEKYFKNLPEALENVEKIVDRCNLEITLGKWLFTEYKLPEGVTADEALRELVYTGIKKKNVTLDEVTKKRIEYELDVIKTKGYATYFLVVSDLLHFAHDNHILTTIRGSVAGSMVTYLAGITNVNPIEYKLPFERFLNPERPSAPDIDMDYADNRRDEMIAYARHKYGNDKVAQIGTFGTMMARGAVRDVTRALGYDYSLGDRIAKLIPMGAQGFPMTIDRAFEEVPELKKMYKAEKEVKDIIDMAKKIEGCARHISVHAAGVVISPIPLSEIVPLQFDPKGEGKIITQYDMHSVDENNAGLLKFDFLGIRNLAILADAVSLVKKIENVTVDIENIPLQDAKTFDLLAKGETVGLFQLNGSGMTRFLKELKPTTIHDINAMVALYRPGPMETIPEYIRRKHNPKLVSYPDPRMKKYLEESHGLIVYQDDLLFSAIELAGYSWLEADKFRKAVGKKIPAEMAAQKEKLVEGIVKNGQTKEFAEKLWALFEPFQAYGFNKAHAASYGKVAYQTAYMKANFPAIYMAAVLTAESGDVEKIAEIIAECKRMGIPVLAPNINESFEGFTVVKGGSEKGEDQIRFGLTTIKNFGEGIAKSIITERKAKGKFKSLEDFLNRITDKNLNKKSLEALIKAGAMDEFGERGQMLANMEDILAYNKEKNKNGANQDSLFGNDSLAMPSLRLQVAPPAAAADKLLWEKELLGLYISGHPLDKHRAALDARNTNIEKMKLQLKEGMIGVVAGILDELKEVRTKKGDIMYFAKMSDFSGSIEVVLFPKICEQFKQFIVLDKCIAIKGRMSMRNGTPSIVAEAVKAL
ncbi:MAG: DNA polymerase III subunit alpha [bacterium]